MKLIDIKSTTITEKGQISIPTKIRKQKGLKKGTKLAVLSYDDRIEIRAFKDFDKKLEMAFASQKVLSKDWDSKEEDEAWKNL